MRFQRRITPVKNDIMPPPLKIKLKSCQLIIELVTEGSKADISAFVPSNVPRSKLPCLNWGVIVVSMILPN